MAVGLQTVASMERAQEAADRQRQARAAELNRAGVFGKSVNAVRASSMYRVELRRKMQPAALRRRPVEAEEAPLSLEASLQVSRSISSGLGLGLGLGSGLGLGLGLV